MGVSVPSLYRESAGSDEILLLVMTLTKPNNYLHGMYQHNRQFTYMHIHPCMR